MSILRLLILFPIVLLLCSALGNKIPVALSPTGFFPVVSLSSAEADGHVHARTSRAASSYMGTKATEHFGEYGVGVSFHATGIMRKGPLLEELEAFQPLYQASTQLNLHSIVERGLTRVGKMYIEQARMMGRSRYVASKYDRCFSSSGGILCYLFSDC